MAFVSFQGSNPLFDPDGSGLGRLRFEASEIALPLLDHPGGRDLLRGYAILLDLWLLEDWLAHPDGEGPLETWQPYRMLLSQESGNNGYLTPLMDD